MRFLFLLFTIGNFNIVFALEQSNVIAPPLHVFVSQNTHDGDFTETGRYPDAHTGADAFCQAEADQPGTILQGHTWHAWISTRISGGDAKKVVDITKQYGVQFNNKEYRIINDPASWLKWIPDAPDSRTGHYVGLLSPINITQYGTLIQDSNPVWTGTYGDGTAIVAEGDAGVLFSACNNFTEHTYSSNNPKFAGAAGDMNQFISHWTFNPIKPPFGDGLTMFCNKQGHVYCFQSDAQ